MLIKPAVGGRGYHEYGVILSLPKMTIRSTIRPALTTGLIFFLSLHILQAQSVTGVWEGRILFPQGALARPYNVELRIERRGDSLMGVCYYYTGLRDYVKVPVRGYFDPYDGTVRWWHTDGSAIDAQGRLTDARVGGSVQFETDFNCPGEGIMRLDGQGVTGKDMDRGRDFAVHLRKTDQPYVPEEFPEEVVVKAPPKPAPTVDPEPKPISKPPVEVITTRPAPAPAHTPAPAPVGMDALFRNRTKTYVGEIPVTGDSLSMDFYDNAQIDGDSISIFLDGRMIATHVLLKARPFTLKIAVSDLAQSSELTMVAENLGSIPPNTSLMIAWVNGVRHEMRLESTEQTSATIRLKRMDNPPR
jgi:hypothetical protein